MSLKTQIDEDIKSAMREKRKDDLRALRAIKSMILLAETEKGAGTELDDQIEIQILNRAAKQRRESLTVFKEQGRDDLAEKEQQELDVIEKYLPEQLSEEDLEVALKTIISNLGASSPSDMGKVMGAATKDLAGKVDGKLISAKVKALLS